MSNSTQHPELPFKLIQHGRGMDIASQKQDSLDLSCLEFIKHRLEKDSHLHAVDLGGGLGSNSIAMAKLGASVTMVDLADTVTDHFPDNLKFIQKDFRELKGDDFPNSFDVIYSQRAIHYLPYLETKQFLEWMYSQMNPCGSIFISAAGMNAEYGSTYLDRDKLIEYRFNHFSQEMQQKYNVHQKLVLYRETEMEFLLKDIGFADVTVTSSEFGTVKAIGRKL